MLQEYTLCIVIVNVYLDGKGCYILYVIKSTRGILIFVDKIMKSAKHVCMCVHACAHGLQVCLYTCMYTGGGRGYINLYLVASSESAATVGSLTCSRHWNPLVKSQPAMWHTCIHVYVIWIFKYSGNLPNGYPSTGNILVMDNCECLDCTQTPLKLTVDTPLLMQCALLCTCNIHTREFACTCRDFSRNFWRRRHSTKKHALLYYGTYCGS